MSTHQHKLVTLKEWAALKFQKPPSRETLRRWHNRGCIYPSPEKIGGRNMVPANAEYINPDSPKAPKLIDRVRGS
jgi:hypothetical protein